MKLEFLTGTIIGFYGMFYIAQCDVKMFLRVMFIMVAFAICCGVRL